MLAIFDCVLPWPTKVNFVDHNNTMLGYDMEQNCCESATWFFLHEEDGTEEIYTLPPGDWVFDTRYNKRESVGMEHGVVEYRSIFRLYDTNDATKKLYLVLSNAHNGYYSHGFELTCCMNILEGAL